MDIGTTGMIEVWGCSGRTSKSDNSPSFQEMGQPFSTASLTGEVFVCDDCFAAPSFQNAWLDCCRRGNVPLQSAMGQRGQAERHEQPNPLASEMAAMQSALNSVLPSQQQLTDSQRQWFALYEVISSYFYLAVRPHTCICRFSVHCFNFISPVNWIPFWLDSCSSWPLPRRWRRCSILVVEEAAVLRAALGKWISFRFWGILMCREDGSEYGWLLIIDHCVSECKSLTYIHCFRPRNSMGSSDNPAI